ncbi:hypothetical protein AGR6A_Lc20009 [Agrobacterium sp. NCPPB 925]|nr:hypothetical protein AGR6A_Lc20009 [Agrobacterium sp. NCPPB 925]
MKEAFSVHLKILGVLLGPRFALLPHGGSTALPQDLPVRLHIFGPPPFFYQRTRIPRSLNL